MVLEVEKESRALFLDTKTSGSWLLFTVTYFLYKHKFKIFFYITENLVKRKCVVLVPTAAAVVTLEQ